MSRPDDSETIINVGKKKEYIRNLYENCFSD